MTRSDPSQQQRPPGAWRRVAVYVVTSLALAVVLWSLAEGNDRDLWRTPSAFVDISTTEQLLLPNQW